MDYYRRVKIAGEGIEEVVEQEPLIADVIPGYEDETRLTFSGLDDTSADVSHESPKSIWQRSQKPLLL